MTLSDQAKKIEDFFKGVDYPATPTEEKPELYRYYCRECSDFAVVEKPGDICPKCKAEHERGYQGLVKLGRLANGFASDHGENVHAVPFGSNAAKCTTKPGPRSVGWSTPTGSRDITCPACLKKLEKEGKK